MKRTNMNHSNCRVVSLKNRQPVCSSLFVLVLLMVPRIVLAVPVDPNPGFNEDDLLSVHIGDFAYTTSVIQQSDGSLVLTGHGGALAAISQGDGKIVLAGYAIDSKRDTDIALARFNTDGNLDPSFDGDGKATLHVGGTNEHAVGLALQPGGKLVLAGQSDAGGSNRAFLARYDVTGTLDVTFGEGGLAFVNFGGGLSFRLNDLAQQAEGKLVLAGTVDGAGKSQLGLARMTANGALDSSFHGDGLLLMDFEGGLAAASSVAIQSDGSIVIAGYKPLSEKTPEVVLLRVNVDRSADDSLESVGKAIVDQGESGALFALGLQTNGRLVATGLIQGDGSYLEGDGSELVVSHLGANGELGTTHGVERVAIVDFGRRDQISSDDGTFSAARLQDNSTAPGRIGLITTLRSEAEEDARVSYVVRRMSGRAGVVSVDYATSAGTALPESDFDSASGTLVWNPGDVDDKTITINVNDDSNPEGNESFLLSLTSPTGGAVLAASEATTFIRNADGPGELLFASAAFGGGAMSGTEGESDQVPVARVNGSEGRVRVSYNIINSGNATLGEDFAISGTLTWTDGETGVKFIHVEYLEDVAVEGDESFQIELTTPTGGATIRPSGRRQAMIIVDNDAGFGLPDTAISVSENGGSLQFVVAKVDSLNRAASVDFATAGGSAVAGSDYSTASGTLTWAAGDSGSKTIEIPLINDQGHENNESFTVSLSNPTAGIALGPNSTATVTIVDDDLAPPPPPPPPRGGGGTTGLELLALLGLLQLLGRECAKSDGWRLSLACSEPLELARIVGSI